MDKVLFAKQRELELRTANYHLDLYFEDDREEFIDKPMDYIFDYLTDCEDKDYEYEVSGETRIRNDLIEIDTWLQELDFTFIQDTLFKMMTLIHSIPEHTGANGQKYGGVTAQALVGMIFNKLPMEDHTRKLKAAGIFLDAIASSPLVIIRNTMDKIYFQARTPLNAGKQKEIKSLGHPLPMLYPPKVKENSSVGFSSFRTSMIAGGSLKHHDKDICLDHFNRLNQMEFTCELRLGLMIEPKFSWEPKVKDSGEWEEQKDVIKRYEQFKRDKEEMPIKIREMVKLGNKFYIPHYADTRIRTYAKQHTFNYLGSKFAKGMVQFTVKEAVEGEW